MAIRSNFPSIKPSLLLDFANTKALDPRITFTRATTATYYDGVTTAKAEENLALQSQTFGSTSWTKTGSATVTDDSTTAPDGTSTADTLNGAAGSSYIIQAIPITTGLSYTFSVFAKANSTDFLQIAGGSSVFGTEVWANFNLSAGTVGSTGTLSTASITSVGSGWYRCVVTGTSTATSAVGNCFGIIPVESSSATRFPTNAGATSIYIWGAQLEQRSSVTAYTATTTAPITNYIPALQTAASGVARFEHNPVTGESLGLEIEEQRTNLLTYSDDFTNAYWSKYKASVTSNTIVAPDGTLTGDKLVENTDTDYHELQGGFTLVAGTTYSVSVYAKSAERTAFSLGVGNLVYGFFNLATGVATVGAGNANNTVISASMTAVKNGWYRCVAVVTRNNTNLANSPIIALSNTSTPSNTDVSYTGDGYSGIYIWGAQLEAGSFATSYIPTVAASVTRNADAASMTGTNFSSWYNAGEGTLYAESASVTTYNRAASITAGGSASVIIGLSNVSPNTSRMYVSTSAGEQANISRAFTGSFAKEAGAYKTNDIILASNGLLSSADTSCVIPVVNQMQIGFFPPVGASHNGTIKKIAYYPIRVTNAQLQALTTV
jgi:hypothetical protein